MIQSPEFLSCPSFRVLPYLKSLASLGLPASPWLDLELDANSHV